MLTRFLFILSFCVIFTNCDKQQEDETQKTRSKVRYIHQLGSYQENWFTGTDVKTLKDSSENDYNSGQKKKLEMTPIVMTTKEYGKASYTYLHDINSHHIKYTKMVIPYSENSYKNDSEWSSGTVLYEELTDSIVSLNDPKPYTLKESTNYQKHMSYLDVSGNLFGSYISEMYEDSKGNIWLTGFEGGSKYCPEYSQKVAFNRIPSPWFNNISEDNKGILYFGIRGSGLLIYDGEHSELITKQQGLKSDSISSLKTFSDGNVYITYSSGGISKISDNKIYHLNQTPLDTIGFETIDELNGSIVLIDGNKTITEISPQEITHFQVETTADNYNETAIDTVNHRLYITSADGLFEFDFKLSNLTKLKVDSSQTKVFDVLHKNGTTYFGTRDHGLLVYADDKISSISEKQGLITRSASALAIDGADNIWIGSYGYGVNILRKSRFEQITNRDYFDDEFIMAITEGQESIFLAGYNAVLRIKNDSLFKINLHDSLQGSRVYGVQEIEDTLYLSLLDKGILKIDPNLNCTLLEDPDEDNTNKFRRLDKLNDSTLFFGKDNGLIIFEDGIFYRVLDLPTFKTYSQLSRGENMTMLSLYNGGFAILEDDSIIHYSEQEGLSSNEVICSTIDDYGNIWYGHLRSGIEIIANDSIFNLTTQDGLAGNFIASITIDEFGDIWISSSTGVSHLKYPENPNSWKDFEIINYSNSDGMDYFDFHTNSSFLDKEGKLWLGGSGGVQRINPKLVISNSLSCKFVSIKVNNTLISKSEFDQLSKSDIGYEENNLKILFSVNEFVNTNNLEYSYRIKTINSKWTVTEYAFADFQNIPPGKHVVEVRLRQKGGAWSEPISFSLEVLSPWYETWWAIILYITFGILVVFGVIRWQTAKLRRRQLQLEEKINVATAEIRSQKEVVEKQKHIVEEAHKEITDSINYAERIQKSFLATKKTLDENLLEYFVFFKPKEAVSGDFYWAGKLNDGKFSVVNADSTGHGVPGAIMSILNITSIEKAVGEGITKPAEIFNSARTTIIERLKKDGSEEGGKDGMDASIIVFDSSAKKLEYCAANNPIWIVRNGELIDIKPEKMPVGKHDKQDTPFEGGVYKLEKGDVIYTLTDGFQDQFGGPKGKKYKIKPFKNFLLSIADLPLAEQRDKLETEFSIWKENNEQVDDVCIIGVRV